MRILCGKKFRFIFMRGKQNSLLCWRSFKKLNDSVTASTFDPFKKKSYSDRTEIYESRNSNRICITILGNGGFGQPRCVGLFTEFKGYLFNCGEGVGRYCKEYSVGFFRIKHIFITQRKWENVSGVAEIFIENQTRGVRSMCLYGPPGVEAISSILSAKTLDTQLLKKEDGYKDHTVNISHIPIIIKKETFSRYKRNIEDEPRTVYSYICKILERPGEFLTEKCIEKGVPIGPHLLKLKNGEDVVLPCGKIVFSEDVNGPSSPEKIIIIADCPSESFLQSFVNEENFKQYQMPYHSSSPIFVFHFTPVHIFNSEKYQKWMNRFHKDTQHFALNYDNPVLGGTVAHQLEKYLNLLHPKIFEKLRDKELVSVQNSFNNCMTESKLMYLPPMLQIHLRPKEEFSWYNVTKDYDNTNVTVDGIDIVKQSPEFYDKLEDLKATLLKKSFSIVQNDDIYPEVVFLGTGSATSTAFRSVSAILVNTDPNRSILLDCGGGTMMQFVRYFGSDVDSALRKISCIFVSHKHLDHYMGLFEIISQRRKAFYNSGIPYKPVALILPPEIHKIFLQFTEVFQNLYPAVRIYKSQSLMKMKNCMQQFIGDLQLSTVPVIHCPHAHGIVLESESNWKIVYSGDAAPCQTLIDAGKDCTLLIHEASIEDDFVNEALSKNHSTPSQVIDIAKQMNAQYTILTHFSKRYLGLPIIPECNTIEIACAFDFMKVQRRDLPLLSHFTPILKWLFEGHLQSYEENTSKVVNFENAFYKVLKS